MSSQGSGGEEKGDRWSTIRASLVSLTARLPSRTRVFSLSAILIVLLSTVFAPYTVSLAGAVGAATGLYNIPEPEPGVDRSYEGTYRLLASNDKDVSPDNLDYEGYDTRVAPVELGRGAQSPTQVLRYAPTTDFYRTQLSDYSTIPYQDEWIPYSEWERTGYTKIKVLLVRDNLGYDGPKSKSGKWYVLTTNQYGDWRPVHNAEIRPSNTPSGLKLANPDEALVHSSKGENVIFRSLHATDQYLQYSANAPSDQAARSSSAVPMVDGRELYPTKDGGYIDLAWRSGRHAVVKDAWVGINNVFRGAWYKGRYVLGDGQVGAYVPWDYRIDVPDDYSRDTTCRIAHHHNKTVTEGNRTYTKTWTTYTYPPKTEWEKYRLVDSSATVESVRLDAPGFNGRSELNKFGSQGVWIGMDEQTSRPYEYPLGDYTLTATIRVDATVEKRWGVTSEKCSSFSKESTEDYSVTQSYDVPVTVASWDADGLNISATIVDSANKDRVLLRWDGDQDFTANPWSKITVTVGQKEVEVSSPWRFYPVARNTDVEVRSESGVDTHSATHSYNDRWPAIFHWTVGVGNISVEQTPDSKYGTWWRNLAAVPAGNVSGNQLSENIVAPGNDDRAVVLESFAGEFGSLNASTGESARISATTVFGGPIDSVSVKTVRSHKSNLSIVQTVYLPDGDGSRIQVRLTDAAGNPLPGRTITSSGSKEGTVTTNQNGIAWFTFQGFYFKASYAGDFWSPVGETYYSGSSATQGLVNGVPVSESYGQIGDYLNDAVDRTLLIVEWIALGLFALWWVRRRRARAA